MAEWYEKKVGPLPLGVWTAVIAAGLAYSYYRYSQQTSSAPTIVEDTSGVPDVGRRAAGWQYDPPPDTTTKDPTDFDTNEQWARYVIDELIAMGYEAGLVDGAIRNYIAGNGLTDGEQAVVNIALRKWGGPPQVLPPVYGEEPEDTGTDSSGTVAISFPSITGNSVTLAWEPVEGATSYRVERFGRSGLFTYQQRSTNTTSSQWTGLRQNTPYRFKVSARNNGTVITSGDAWVTTHLPGVWEGESVDAF